MYRTLNEIYHTRVARPVGRVVEDLGPLKRVVGRVVGGLLEKCVKVAITKFSLGLSYRID